MVSNGMRASDIASTLYLSRGTIKTHLGRSYKKLGVHNRVEAVGLALRTGLIV